MAISFGRDQLIARLRAASPAVLPSMLLCDFGNFAREIEQVAAAGAEAIHLDVMDGHFVPNFTYGMTIVETARRLTELPLDVHLMIDNPARYVDDFRRAGADIMTIHAEAVDDPRPLLDKIRSLGALAGLAINPPTTLESIESCLSHCDLILVMSVMPGFGGQKFDQVALDKLRELRGRSDVSALLEIDGGINVQTAPVATAAGAELLVAGSAIFRAGPYASAIRSLRAASIADFGSSKSVAP